MTKSTKTAAAKSTTDKTQRNARVRDTSPTKTVTLVSIARDMNIDPKRARAKFRRMFGNSNTHDGITYLTKWVFDAKHDKKVRALLTS